MSFFAHFGQFSKLLSGFNNSYLSQMTIKNCSQYIKTYISSLVIQGCFTFENYSFIVHFMLDKTGVLVCVPLYYAG